ncbi:MAG TPA: hypothetical protein VFL95_04160 [Gemmatimonadales bacterium]|nr:hypothetical protein [Gemmatimonadales bacterium]
MKLVWSAALVAAVLAGCHSDSASHAMAWHGTVDTLGDTIVVTTVSGWTGNDTAAAVVDSVAPFSAGAELNRPSSMVRLANGDLIVVDVDHLVRIGPDGAVRGTIGRQGSGPGEFQQIGGLGVTTGDTIMVFDTGNSRVTRFTANGDLVDSRTSALHFTNTGFSDGARIPATGDIVIGGMGPFHRNGSPTAFAVEVQRAGSDSVEVVDSLVGPSFVMKGSGSSGVMMLGPRDLFDRVPMFAVSNDGKVAATDGLDYCIEVDSIGAGRHRRVCRQFARVPVTDAVRHPDIDAVAQRIGMSDAQRKSYTQMIGSIHVGDTHNAISRVQFDDAGRLWVRIVDSAQAGVHPWLAARDASLRPAHYVWDVFGRDGRQAGRVLLPSTFDPREIMGDTVYGILELDTGEQVVGKGVVRHGP